VTFLRTAAPMSLAHWPATVADDCAANVRIAQGFLPDTAAFDPTEWHRLQ
jgi:hypothetical protein